MELILWRHAEAEDSFPDMDRKLTKKGRQQAKAMATFLNKYLPPDARILVSPAQRTQQTANALGRAFLTVPGISPGCSPQDILHAADWPNESGCVLVVGHQPSLGIIASLLMAGEAQYWSIKKGAVWWLSRRVRDGEAEIILRLTISPDIL